MLPLSFQAALWCCLLRPTHRQKLCPCLCVGWHAGTAPTRAAVGVATMAAEGAAMPAVDTRRMVAPMGLAMAQVAGAPMAAAAGEPSRAAASNVARTGIGAGEAWFKPPDAALHLALCCYCPCTALIPGSASQLPAWPPPAGTAPTRVAAAEAMGATAAAVGATAVAVGPTAAAGVPVMAAAAAVPSRAAASSVVRTGTGAGEACCAPSCPLFATTLRL
jgi:hypothetical protein